MSFIPPPQPYPPPPPTLDYRNPRRGPPGNGGPGPVALFLVGLISGCLLSIGLWLVILMLAIEAKVRENPIVTIGLSIAAIKIGLGVVYGCVTRRWSFLAGILVSIAVVPLTCFGLVYATCGGGIRL